MNKEFRISFLVTDKSTSEHKAKIQNLKGEDLKLLALTNLNLSELYKLRSKATNNHVFEEHTYHNLTVIENVSSVDNNLNLNELSVINETSTENQEVAESKPLTEELVPDNSILEK